MRVMGQSLCHKARLLCVCMAGVLSLRPSLVAADEGKETTKNETAFRVSPGERQLLMDDYGIAKIENLVQTMHRPDKKGAVIRPDPHMGEDFIQNRTAPIWDPEAKVFKFWNLYGPGDLPGVVGYYESKDGLHWTKPVVGQIEYRGSRQNNYLAVERDGRRHRISMVVYDAADPDPKRRFKSFRPNVGSAVSPDGIRWRMLDVPAVPSGDNFSFPLTTRRTCSWPVSKPAGRTAGPSPSPPARTSSTGREVQYSVVYR